MNNIYFIADTHFSHIMMSKMRGFDSVEEHDETIIKAWNDTVDNGDRIYILGDFIWNGADTEYILKQLNGEKFLITGNHDRIGKHNETVFLKYVRWIKYYFVLKIKNGSDIPSTKIVLSHYPFEVWDSDHYGSLHFHGHIHGYCRHKPLQNLPNRFDAVVRRDNGWKPFEYNWIIQYLKENDLYKKDYKEELRIADELQIGLKY